MYGVIRAGMFDHGGGHRVKAKQKGVAMGCTNEIETHPK